MDNQPVGVSALDMSHIRVRSTRLAREQEIIIEIESTLATAVCRCPYCADHPTTVEQFTWPAPPKTSVEYSS